MALMEGSAEPVSSAGGPLAVPETLHGSRFALVSRRAFLARMMGAGAGVAALAVGLAACGNDDAAVFATGTTDGTTSSTAARASSTTAPPASSSTIATTAPPTTAAPTTAAPTTAAPTTAPPETAAPTTAAARAAGLTGQATVQFSYTASGGGRINNPYVAVWIENADGALVHTVALWFLQSQKGMRWLPDLRRWNSVDGSQTTIDTVSGATRTPGDYSVSWNLTDDTGAPVPAGSYFVCIEAAREHGPYSLVRQSVALAPGRSAVDLAPNGELSNGRFDLVSA